jgi:hypothetical protein
LTVEWREKCKQKDDQDAAAARRARLKAAQASMLEKIKAQQKKFLETSSEDLSMDFEENETHLTCCYCQQPTKPNRTMPLGLLALVQRSRVLPMTHERNQWVPPLTSQSGDNSSSKRTPTTNNELPQILAESELYSNLESSDPGPHISFCGHAIHTDCLKQYYDSLLRSYIHREVVQGGTSCNVPDAEFLCPLW